MNIEKEIERLIETTEAILAGDLDAAKDFDFNGEGIIFDLARQINSMVNNLRQVEMPLASAGDKAPVMTGLARDVLELMDQSTTVVLDKTDRLTDLCDKLAESIPDGDSVAENNLASMKAAIFDIVASQSYQDVARQKMEGLARDLEQVRDWLLEVLLILNLRKPDAAASLKEKAKKLTESRERGKADMRQQDLVDDLLAEFGF